MTENNVIAVRKRQDPLQDRYKDIPNEAAITDRARTTGGVDADPFHCQVIPGSKEYDVVWPFGIHSLCRPCAQAFPSRRVLAEFNV